MRCVIQEGALVTVPLKCLESTLTSTQTEDEETTSINSYHCNVIISYVKQL